MTWSSTGCTVAAWSSRGDRVDRHGQIAVPLHPLFDGLGADERAATVREVIEGLRGVYDGTSTNTTAAIVVVSGTR